jgi:hypothetical protein
MAIVCIRISQHAIAITIRVTGTKPDGSMVWDRSIARRSAEIPAAWMTTVITTRPAA